MRAVVTPPIAVPVIWPVSLERQGAVIPERERDPSRRGDGGELPTRRIVPEGLRARTPRQRGEPALRGSPTVRPTGHFHSPRRVPPPSSIEFVMHPSLPARRDIRCHCAAQDREPAVEKIAGDKNRRVQL